MKKISKLHEFILFFKRLLVLILGFFSTATILIMSPCLADDIWIELGQEHVIPSVKSKVWIENSSVLQAHPLNNSIIIKPLKLGRSKVKTDSKTHLFFVVPEGFQSSLQIWKKQINKFPTVNIEHCEEAMCLSGSIFNFEEFEKIMSVIEKEKAPIFLNLKIKNETQVQVEKWYENYFRNHEITPMKIIFSSPWKTSLSSKDDSIENRNRVQKVGLYTQENKNKLDMSDNIKVEVKFIEVKKSFMRQMGIAWPQSYSATVVTQGATTIEDLELKLNAAESTGDSKILANPNLICRSGKEAEFLAGGEIPIKMMSFKYNDVVWKKYGIQLKIKPLIDPLGQMSIQIETEVSTPDYSRAIEGIPTIHTNKVSSHFDLIKSQTIAISGLLQSETGQTKDGLPYLTSLPVLGPLFSSQMFKDNQSELVIFVTPSLMQQ